MQLLKRDSNKLANAPAPAHQSTDRQRLELTVPVEAVIAMHKLAKRRGHDRSPVFEAVRILRQLEWSR